ncbi:transposase [Caballeronia calidae]|uniref:Transposase n=1 Tax=Caballeronia calidae TaxID=1777139 RepID=A0A158ED59_9BURK|nr:transposase [Caballeronia calidae]
MRIGKDLPGHRTGNCLVPSWLVLHNLPGRGKPWTKITRVGVDLAKNVMQVHAVDGAGRVMVRKAIARQRFVSGFANLEPCLVAMEACGAAH